jgi:acyl carrier protein
MTVEDAIKNPIAASPIEAQLLCGISRAQPGSETKEAAVQRADAKFSHIWRKDTVVGQRTVAPGQIDVPAALRACNNPEEAFDTTSQAIKAKLARLLSIPADEIRVDRSITSHGIDSLIAVELRNWMSTSLEAQIQIFELMSSMTFSDLVMLIAKRSRLIRPEVFAGI